MRTIYIYLSWTGWIWFVISMTYLTIQLRKKRTRRPEHTADDSSPLKTPFSDRPEGGI